MIGGLGAAREDDVRLPAADRGGGLADRRRPRRAGRHGREVLAVDPELDRDLAARRVDEHGRNEERGDAVEAALGERLLLLGNRRDAADRRPDENPDARRVDAFDPGVVPRLLRSGHGEEHVPIHAAGLFRRDEIADVEAPHLGRDANRVLGRVERLDPPHPAPAGYRGVPRRRRVEPDWRDGPEAGDRDPPHGARDYFASEMIDPG